MEENVNNINEILRKNVYSFDDLIKITEILRSPEGCAWDREQNHKSIRQNLLEEAYETAEAIDNNDAVLLKEELGDVLLQVVFHARISEESGDFNIDDICDGICKKLVERHPHVFGGVKAGTPDEALMNWEKIKANQKSGGSVEDEMKRVCRALPSLMRAQKLQKKAGLNSSGAASRISECCMRISDADDDESAALIGSMLFDVVLIALDRKINAEDALEEYNNKFLNKTILKNNEKA